MPVVGGSSHGPLVIPWIRFTSPQTFPNSLYSSHNQRPLLLPRCPEILPLRSTQDVGFQRTLCLRGGMWRSRSCVSCSRLCWSLQTGETARQVPGTGPARGSSHHLLLVTSACPDPPHSSFLRLSHFLLPLRPPPWTLHMAAKRRFPNQN